MGRDLLTHQENLDIQTRCAGDPDVRALLWEIKRQSDIITQVKGMRQSIDQA